MGARTMGLFLTAVALTGCTTADFRAKDQTFGGDVAFLRKHTEVVLLQDRSGDGQVVVLPAMQGRVMTSTAGGGGGNSFGWINRELIASGEILPHMNPFGGEDRFWLGPEGGQFSIFFAKDVPFDLDHWQTPAPIDTEPFKLTSKSQDTATLRKTMKLVNYSGTAFDVQVDRQVRVLDRERALEHLGVSVGSSVKMVAFESNNRMTNVGSERWRKQTGLLSIWILGMFNPSPQTTVVIPFNTGPESQLGPVVNDAYFGKVPASRLMAKDGVLFFSGDGQFRSKIGLSPERARDVAGSYDAAGKVLTIVQYNKPHGVSDYVNSMWELQDEPYRGDVINAYNDGPPEPGAKPLGPFYELETSSPAAALAPGQSIVHTHRTFHLVGSEAELDPIARTLLGVTIAEITSALP
ncbi:DUF6786 family protein [Anaerobaca lacustris]|uniref:Lipoprotein n=1 Tax=Anaerobaca lacustris TaxID=3044600 RepID=A0AAW6TWV0_9BACT|nr:hypothetical protein [Sedimentisphaerales bacterium M17dextr]